VERLIYLAPDALNPPDEGAAAHMSLHHSNNEKEQTAQSAPFLLPCRQERKVGTDLAVNRVPLESEAPLTRGYLWRGRSAVNRKMAILLRSLHFHSKIAGNLPEISS
jgi:hypothetical protein